MLCWLVVSVPPNSDMDYRIFFKFNVRTWSFLCMRIHTVVGHTVTASQHNILDSEKATHFSCAPDTVTGFELGSLMSLNLESDALPTEPPRHITGHKVSLRRQLQVQRAVLWWKKKNCGHRINWANFFFANLVRELKKALRMYFILNWANF